MARRLVFRSQDVKGFSIPGMEDMFESRMLVDEESVGSRQMVANQYTLKPGKANGMGSHPEPFDELYYVARGRGLLRLAEAEDVAPDVYEIGPGTVAFIPAGMLHGLENTGDEDLNVLTVVPRPLIEGVNGIYDARRKAWGHTFKLTDEP